MRFADASRILTAVLVSLALSDPAGAAAGEGRGVPTAGAPGVGDPLYPLTGNGGIDVRHYALDIAWNDETSAIDATATLDIRATRALSAFKYRRDGDELTIVPEAPLPRAGSFEVAVEYRGVPEPIPGSVTSGWERLDSGVVVMAEPVAAKNWFPNNNHPTDKATYSFRVTVPKPYSVAANGLPGETEDHGATRTFTFSAREPMATYLATVNIGEFDLERTEGPGGVPILNYFFTGATGEQKAPFRRYPEMLAFFSERFGPYPFAAAGNIMHREKSGVGMETQTRAVFGAGTSENTVAHETAHQWFGGHVSLERWNEIWLKEGFSRYAEGLWREPLEGGEAMQAWVTDVFGFLMGKQRVPKEGWADLEHFFQIEETSLTPEQITRIIDLGTGGRTDPAELEKALSLVPGGGLSNRKLDTVLAPISFEYFDLTMRSFNELNALVAGKPFDPDQVPSFNETVRKLAEPPEGVDSRDKMYSTGVYSRAALAMHALRLKMGDDAFFRMLRTWFGRFSGGSASYADFKAVAAEVSGTDPSRFFADWMEAELIPDLPQFGLRKADYR